MINWQEQAAKAQQAVVKGIEAIFPYEGKIHRLEASRIWVDQVAGASTDYAMQKKVKGAGRTLSAPVYGAFKLIDIATGKVVDKTSKIKVTSIPIPTTRNSYIVNGSEYQVPNQLRLRPGVYTRVGNDGDLQAQVNLAKGKNFKIYLNPKNWIFYMRVDTANIMLYHILTAFGVSGQEIKNVWGDEIAKVNSTKSSQDTEIKKLHKSLIGKEVPSGSAEIIAELTDYFGRTEIDKETTSTTLGKSYSSVNTDLILRTTEKLLGILRGKEKTDDRDSLEFKEALSVDDFLGERISKKAYIIKNKLRNNIDRQTEIRRILVPGIFSQHIDSFFTSGETGLSSTPEQTNPIHMIQESDKAILTGMGGITNEHAITTEARAVHPSSLGFIDGLNTPESSKIGTTLHLPLGVEKKGRQLYTTVYDVKTGKTVKLTPKQASASVLSFRDQFELKAGKLKAKSAKVKASTGGTIKMVPAGKVQYVFPTSQAAFDVSTNMLPFLPSNQGNRAMMASKQLSQALPLVNREAPHVQVVSEAGRTFESAVGQGFSHKAPVGGTVTKITDDAMHVKGADGKSHKVPTYKNYPLNGKTGFIDSEPKVKVGDKVRKGQLMADTNFTKNGELALGVNAKVAYISHKGWNFEDGTTISESFADKATSQHMYKLHADVDKDTVLELKRFRAYYPDAVDLAMSAKLDETGVIKKGQKVRMGDMVIAVLRKEATSPEDVILSRIHKAFVKPYKNRSITWDEEDEGEVVEVVRNPKKVEVHIRTNEKVKIGDKFSSRNANKGIVSAIIPDAEMPHTKDGTPIDLTLNPTSIPSRINPSQILETAAGKIAEKTGKRFEVRNFSGEDYLDSVEKAAKKAGVVDKEDLYDPNSGKTIPGVNVGSQYMLKLDHPTRKKFSARAQGPGYTSELQPTRGKATGGQALDQLTLYSMLAHGAKCIMGSCCVRTKEGRDVQISDIVRNRRRIDVLSMDPKTGEFAYKPVVAWSVRVADPDELMYLTYSSTTDRDKRKGYKLKLTKNHSVYTDRGKICAGDICAGDMIIIPGIRMSDVQKSVIMGCLMGDSSLAKCDKQNSHMNFGHGIKQEKYCRWKYALLDGFTRKNPTIQEARKDSWGGAKVRFSTLASGEFSELRRRFYPDGTKRITADILQDLDEVSLAFWFMDDGSCCTQKSCPQRYRIAKLHTCGFSRQEHELMQQWFLERWGIKAKIFKVVGAKNKDLHELSFFNGEATKLYNVIAPYVHESMRYKMKLDEPGNKVDGKLVGCRLQDLYTTAIQGAEKSMVFEVGPYKPKPYEDYMVYNIEVEDNHTYVVNGSVVGNSNLREMAGLKSEKNDEAWRALQTGQALPAPRTTFAFEKFTDMLRGAGVNVTKNGNELALGPLTDKQVSEMSNGEIKNSMVVRGKDLKPEKGGLFDQALTGGIQGETFNHIQLAEPMPNPVFENAIKSLLDMRQTIFDDIVGGKRWVDKQGGMHIKPGEGRVTGGAAIKLLLGNVDLKALAQKLEQEAKKKKGADLDKINKKLRYIRALQDNNLKATDYVVTKVPVIPARLRPVYGLADGSLDVTEVNHLYRDLIEVNNHQKDFNKMGMPEEDKAKLRENTYKGMKAVAGLHPSIDGRNRRGLIEQIKGPRNKEGFFQNRIMSRRQEFSGRSTVVPDPELGLDEISIPDAMAWKSYQPFVVRELVRQGYSPLDAREQMEKKTPLARRALQVAMQDRPVMINRAPSLHKFNIMAFKPQLTKGKAVKTNPLIVKGFNLDHDGDTVAVHVPITEEARQESFKMLPSQNLWGPRQGELMNHPSLEAVAGLYMHTITKKGRDEINALLPKGFKITKALTEKDMMKLLSDIGRKSKPEFVRVVNKLKDIGNRESFQRGLTIGLEDLKMDQKAKARIIGEADKEVKKAGGGDDAIVSAYQKASKKMDRLIATDPKLKANGFRIMMDSGAKGNNSQIRQILAAPMLVQDISGRTVPVPIKKAYAQGLDMGDYWASMSGARKGMIDRALQTAEPGALAKEILNSTVSEVVGKPDCGTLKGVDMLLTDPEIMDRYLARNTAGVGRRNELISHHMTRKAKRKRMKALSARSPLTCRLPQGVCQKCYGLDEKGRPPEIGTNVGVIAGQAISERATQLTMRTFHTGAAAGGGGGLTAGFQRVKELLEMPKKLRNQATLAKVDGRVTAARSSPIGGWDVFVGMDKHHVPKSRRLLVKRGDAVKKGQSLSDGSISPQELLELRGMRATQDYLVNQVVNEYDGQGVRIKKQLVETAIRPLTNRVVVTDTGGHPTLVTGDNTTAGMVEDWNEQQLNPNKQIRFEPMLRGINTRPLVTQDWLSRLNFQKLKDTIQEGAGQGWKSDVASPFAPLAAYAYGPTIGRELL